MQIPLHVSNGMVHCTEEKAERGGKGASMHASMCHNAAEVKPYHEGSWL